MKHLLKYTGFGIGALGMDLSYGLFFTFLNYYLTDTLYLHPMFLMVLTFLARVWDGVNDPIMGAIVDSTRSRLGKYRFWLMIGSSANAVVLALLFANPGFAVTRNVNVIDLGLCVYVAIMYVMWDVTNTMMDIPFWSMVPSLATDPKQRNLAATVPRAFSGLGQLVVAVASPIVIPLLGRSEGYNAPGFRNWAVICGAVLIGLMAISFGSTGRIPAIAQAGPTPEKITLRSAWNTVKNNDQLLVFMLMAFLMNTGWYMLTGLATHYFERVVGDGRQQSFFALLMGAGQAAGLLLLPVLTRWLRRNTVIKIAMGMAGIGYLGMYACRANYAAFAVFCLIGMVGVGASFVSQTVMLSDIVDYGGYKLGYRSESVTFSMKGIIQKGAYSVQAVAMFLMLQLTGYDAALATQPQSAQTGITAMMLLVPPVLTAAALVVFSRMYKLDEEAMGEVNGGWEIFQQGFPKAMRNIVLGVVEKIPKQTYLNISSIISSDSTSYHLDDSLVVVPYRVYLMEAPESVISKLNSTEKTILHCIYSRSHDGYVREKHIRSLLQTELPAWAIPYVFKVCDEYIVEILQIVYNRLKDRDTENFKQFCANNRAAFCKTYNRMISYWNVFYRSDCLRFQNYIGRKLFIECFGAERTN